MDLRPVLVTTTHIDDLLRFDLDPMFAPETMVVD